MTSNVFASFFAENTNHGRKVRTVREIATDKRKWKYISGQDKMNSGLLLGDLFSDNNERGKWKSKLYWWKRWVELIDRGGAAF